MPPERIPETWRLAMSIVKVLLVIGMVLTVVKVLLGPDCWFFALEAFVRLLVVAWISAAGA
jgi:hypothetical protein